ncbi:MAG: Ig-like domain-containing protein [Bacteroidetes bacterium]|nr:Ig-like domain-containing protein [Bacteroidota bacterium]MBS1741255.1 Ig-like domain-containing protein [Bacteroidota bacterium]
MNRKVIRLVFVTFLPLILFGCAQIVPPQGGIKDTKAPKLRTVLPADSSTSKRINKIELQFDEFIHLNNPSSEITISPLLPIPLNVIAIRKTVTIKIPDSLLLTNTTYRLNFGNAIQDVHENNPFSGYSYIFSTGTYFDSLRLRGTVFNAATGQKDTGCLVLLYNAEKSDSAIVREKPLYVTHANSSGNFSFEGLPEKPFKIFALRDANNNMIYDGKNEWIAFHDSVLIPTHNPTLVNLYLFLDNDSSSNTSTSERGKTPGSPTPPIAFSYSVMVDTTSLKKRTQDITEPIVVRFTKTFKNINPARIYLSYDSSGIAVEAKVSASIDSIRKDIKLYTNWKENSIYTLRLLKGFVHDSLDADAMPSKHIFHTKQDEDYAKLHVHLPSKYFGKGFIFVLLKDNDTIYHRTVTDTLIHFNRLQPGTYNMRIIDDKNHNSKWDHGNVFLHLQPEMVIPYDRSIMLKAGWENLIDFEEPPTSVRPGATAAPH